MRYDIHRISSIIYQLFQNDQNLFFLRMNAPHHYFANSSCAWYTQQPHIIHHIHHISHTYISNTYLIHISYVHIPYITYLHPTSNIQRGCFYNNYSRTIKTFFLKECASSLLCQFFLCLVHYTSHTSHIYIQRGCFYCIIIIPERSKPFFKECASSLLCEFFLCLVLHSVALHELVL